MTLTKLKVRLYGDPCLRKKSKSVKEVGPGERMLINAMIATMHYEKGIGLAAPQVGINQKIFVADVGDGPVVFVNPKIIKKSGSAEFEEGCLSIPGVNVVVSRSIKIIVQFTDENNSPQERIVDDLMARVIQHEIDHLQGKLITDYVPENEFSKIEEHLKELERLSKQ